VPTIRRRAAQGDPAPALTIWHPTCDPWWLRALDIGRRGLSRQRRTRIGAFDGRHHALGLCRRTADTRGVP